MSKISEERARIELCEVLSLNPDLHDSTTVMYMAKSRISRLSEEKGRIEMFENMLERGRKLWQAAHPEASYWIDGAKNVEWLLDEIKKLEDLKSKAS